MWYRLYFTTKYSLKYLMYSEQLIGMQNAIHREKELKNWHKNWKWNLIKKDNPELKDLAEDWFTNEEIEMNRGISK